MAVVRHLGLLLHLIGSPTKSKRSLSSCKVWLESAMKFWRYASFNVMRVWPGNAYSRPCESKCKIQFCRWFPEESKKWCHKNRKTENHARVILVHLLTGTPPLGRSHWILTWGNIADIINHAKFSVIPRFRSSGTSDFAFFRRLTCTVALTTV